MVMKVTDAPQDLLEDAISIFGLEVFPLHEAEQFTLLAVLHDVIPTAIVCAETNSSHDIGVIERLGNGIFRLDLADVFHFCFSCGFLAKLFDRIVRWAVTLLVSLAKHDLYRGACTFSDFFLAPKLG